MLRRVAQLNLRRCVHTPPPRPRFDLQNNTPLRVAFASGASVVATAYVAWRWAAEDQQSALELQKSVAGMGLLSSSSVPC